SRSTAPTTITITHSRTVRRQSSIAYRTTSGHPERPGSGSGSCFLAKALVGEDFAGLCAVIVPSWSMLRKTPRRPAGEDARPRGVPLPRHGLSRAVAQRTATADEAFSVEHSLGLLDCSVRDLVTPLHRSDRRQRTARSWHAHGPASSSLGLSGVA